MNRTFASSRFCESVLLFVLFSVAAAGQGFAQGGSPDPVFATVPFDRWLAGGEQAQIRWTVGVSAGALFDHQRLRAEATIQVDGKELVKRRGEGQLLMLVQFNDSEGRAYQAHGTLDLQNVTEAAGAQYFVYTQDVLVLPGEYRISLALVDTATGEHSFARRMLRVAPLKNDPLPGAWRDLPPLEFLPAVDPPDKWFLPSLTGRLHLPLETRRPVRIELLVNLTPSEEQASASRRLQNPNLGVLISALKVISQVEVRNGSLDVAVLDLTRRRVSFEQNNVRDLDWPQLKASLKEADSNLIDVRSLENRKQNAEFFAAEVSRRIEAAAGPLGQQSGEPLRIFIVLSGPMVFAYGEHPQPIHPANNPNCRVFHIRYHSLPMLRVLPPLPTRSPSGRRGGVSASRTMSGVQADSQHAQTAGATLVRRVYAHAVSEGTRHSTRRNLTDVTY